MGHLLRIAMARQGSREECLEISHRLWPRSPSVPSRRIDWLRNSAKRLPIRRPCPEFDR